jgi:hypothetical protein
MQSLYESQQAKKNIEEQFGISISTGSEWMQSLAAYIDKLIAEDFQKLVWYLYRLDVSEEKLKALLKASEGSDAGMIIATLILQREEEKMKSRRDFLSANDEIDEREKW